MNKRHLSLFLLLIAITISACSQQQSATTAPVIAEFSADSSVSAANGNEVSLTWDVAGAPTSLTVEPGIGRVTGTSVLVSPTETTTYTLTATNEMGSSSAEVTVEVPVREPDIDDSTSNDHLFGTWQFEIVDETKATITGELLIDAELLYDQTPIVYGFVENCKSTSLPCARVPQGGFSHQPGSDSYVFGLANESATLLFRAEDTDGKLALDSQGRFLLEGKGVLENEETATFKVYKLSN